MVGSDQLVYRPKIDLGEVLEIIRNIDDNFIMYPSPHGGIFVNRENNFIYLLTNDVMDNKENTPTDLANIILRYYKLSLI